jgi:hypothetical protein
MVIAEKKVKQKASQRQPAWDIRLWSVVVGHRTNGVGL